MLRVHLSFLQIVWCEHFPREKGGKKNLFSLIERISISYLRGRREREWNPLAAQMQPRIEFYDVYTCLPEKVNVLVLFISRLVIAVVFWQLFPFNILNGHCF